MIHRIYNFSAGPAMLPIEVLEEARDNLLSLGPTGMGILEISHRSRHFEAILAEAEENLRQLLGLFPDQRVLFLSGGASAQFAMVPMNLLAPGGATADYVVTGVWSQKAVSEARRIGNVHIAASTEKEGFSRIPRNEELALSEDPVYVHTTSNNTVYGTEWQWEPEIKGRTLVCDMSSDFLSRPIDARRYGIIYAGAQKNAGPAGVTVVVIRQDLIRKDNPEVPIIFNYSTHAEAGSLYNTPPVFAIYVMHLVLRWLKKQGGLVRMAEHNQKKAALIYDVIDAAPEFYRGHAQKDSRSLMNITFRLPTPELEERFAREAQDQGMDGLKGHRSVGGLRASLYNAFPMEGAKALADHMKEFLRRNG